MPQPSLDVSTASAGALFGRSIRSLETPSFHFKEMDATVPEREVPRHTHAAPHFILITRGFYVTEAPNQTGVCSAGTLIFNPAGTTHRDRFCSRTGRFVSIAARQPATKMLCGIYDPSIITGPGAEEASNTIVLHRIWKEWRRQSPCPSILEGLGIELLGFRDASSNRQRNRGIPRWLLRVKEMIDDNHHVQINVTSLAAHTGVHPVYLARAYRRYFSCSPGEYLRHRRLLRARSLLSRTNSSLAQIALLCGFNDQSQMTRAFTDGFGISPFRYRRMRRP